MKRTNIVRLLASGSQRAILGLIGDRVSSLKSTPIPKTGIGMMETRGLYPSMEEVGSEVIFSKPFKEG